MKILTRDGERYAIVADDDPFALAVQLQGQSPYASTYAVTDALPNVRGSGKRAGVERALELWVTRKVLFNAYADGDRYTVASGTDTLWERLTLKEASLLVHGCASAWHADRSGS
jgi:hypothetical protein